MYVCMNEFVYMYIYTHIYIYLLFWQEAYL